MWADSLDDRANREDVIKSVCITPRHGNGHIQIELNLWPAHFFRHGLDLSVWILDPVGRDSVVQLVVVSCISE